MDSKTHVPARMEPGEGRQTRQVFILKHTHKHTKIHIEKSREHNEQTAVIRQTRNRQTSYLDTVVREGILEKIIFSKGMNEEKGQGQRLRGLALQAEVQQVQRL